MRHTLLPTLTLALIASFGIAHAAAPSAEAAAAITRFRAEEAAQPVRERQGWRAPRKIVLLQLGSLQWEGRDATLAAAVPQARVVIARDRATAVKEAADADAIIGFNPDVCDARILDGARELRWLQSLSAGVELCGKVPVLLQRNVLMTNMRGVDSPAIAEHAIAMLLALAHSLDHFVMETSRASWQRRAPSVQTLEGKTLLVVGLGGIGTEVAQRAHGLGMKVVATRDRGTGKPDFVSYIGAPSELLTLARTADVVVSSVPLTPETTGLYDKRFFAAMKPTAYFINVARGGSVVTADLTAALNEKRIAGAGLDVTDPEPLPPDNALWKAPRVIISPHISSASDLPAEGRWVLLAENMRRYAAGEKMLSVVDLSKGY